MKTSNNASSNRIVRTTKNECILNQVRLRFKRLIEMVVFR